MKTLTVNKVVPLFLFFLTLFISSCTIKLSPEYDKQLSDSLSQTNTEMLIFFSSISQGTKKETYAKRESNYSSIIGKLDSLATSLNSRPSPSVNNLVEINSLLKKNGVPELPNDVSMPPSVNAVRMISNTMNKMKETDQKQGLTAYEVQAFKGQANVFITQALTYENFLKTK